MKKIASLIMSLALASGAFAGSPAYYSGKASKNPVMPPPPGCEYFAPGAYLGAFGGGIIWNHHDIDDNALGGGVLADYFFCENFGIEVSYGAYATDSTTHVVLGDLIARWPIHSACIAPYLLVGGGLHADGENLGIFHVGAGLEVQVTPRVGVFADGTYNWHNSENRDLDATIVRLGLKFHL